MSDITDFKLTYRLDATIQINGTSWAKPGVEASVGFRGLPEEEQLKLASRFLTDEVVAPLLDDVLLRVVEKTKDLESNTGG